MMDVAFVHKEKVAKNIYSFHFEGRASVRYIAGQFIELYVPHDSADDRGTKRWFTLSSSPTEDQLVITTKILPKGSSSFKQALYSLPLGAKLKMASPMGDFVLPKDESIPLVLVAGGIGCTPFRSIIKYIQDSGKTRDIKLLYAVSAGDEAVFLELFEEELGSNFKMSVSTKDGRLDASKILSFSGNNPGCYYYVSGPEPMVEALEKSLLEAGVEKSHFHGDFFPGYLNI